MEELSEELGVEKEELVQAMEAGGEVDSLYRPIHQKEGSEIRTSRQNRRKRKSAPHRPQGSPRNS